MGCSGPWVTNPTYIVYTEVSQVVQERAEGPKAPTALAGRVELTCES